MKLKHIGSILILGISSLVIVGCGGGSSSSETSSGAKLTINEQNAHQVYASFQQADTGVNDFVSYSLTSLKEIHSPCVPVINGTRILDNCEDPIQNLILSGEVSSTLSSNRDQLTMDYVNFNLTSLEDGTIWDIEKAHIEVNSLKGYGKATITGELTKNGNKIVLNDYTFHGSRNGVTYNGSIKLPDLNKWVSIQAVIPLQETDDNAPCLTKGEVFITGNNSELNATFNSDQTTTLYVNGTFFDDIPSCVN